MRFLGSLLLCALLFTGCEDKGPDIPTNRGQKIEQDWLINEGRVLDGGPGKDGIISLDAPTFKPVNEVGDYLKEEDLVIGLKIGDQIRAYPHPILDWHEIVNDSIDEHLVCLNYCPLTGTGFAWDRQLRFRRSTFGVSGLLYNNNLIMYDRDTDSHWSQLLYMGVEGEYKGIKADLLPVIETSWANWKAMFPNSAVLSEETGHDFPYQYYPYGDYRTQESFFLFSVIPLDQRLHLKERVLAVIDGEEAKVYQFAHFREGLTVFADTYHEKELVIAGSEPDNFMVAYERKLADGTVLDLQKAENTPLPIVFTDGEGNEWDIWGKAISGPRQGTQLTAVESVMAYWFSIGSFYPDAEIY